MINNSILPRTPEGVFANEPFVDFKAPDNERAMRAALAKIGQQLGREYPLVVGGERVKTVEKIRSLNPAKPAQVVGVHQKAGADHAEQAMASALRAFEFWSRVSTGERISLVLNAAHLIRQRKFEFMAWLT